MAIKNFGKSGKPMRLNESSTKPFRVEIGKLETVKRVTEVSAVKIVVNGIEFGGEPDELIEFFERLLDHHPMQSEGLELAVTEAFKDTLLKSRVAVSEDRKRFYPTPDFRRMARDLIAGLRSL